MTTEVTGQDGAGVAGATDLGELAEVPPDRQLEHDPPGDDGLGDTGPEDLSDVPVGEVRWLDGRDGS